MCRFHCESLFDPIEQVAGSEAYPRTKAQGSRPSESTNHRRTIPPPRHEARARGAHGDAPSDQSRHTHFWQPHLVCFVQSARRTRLHCGFSTALHLPALADASVAVKALRNTAAPNDAASNLRTIMDST